MHKNCLTTKCRAAASGGGFGATRALDARIYPQTRLICHGMLRVRPNGTKSKAFAAAARMRCAGY